MICFAGNVALNAVARDGSEIFRASRFNALFLRVATDRVGQRVLGTGFKSGGNFHDLFFIRQRRANHIRHFGRSFGESSCFVEDDCFYFGRRLKRLAALYQNSVFRSFSGANHDRGRRRKSKSARTGDDDDGSECHECDAKRRSDQEEPDEKCKNSHGNDGRNEPSGNSVRKRLNRSSRSLRVFYEFYDLREDCFGPYIRRAEFEASGFIYSRADRLISLFFFNRKTFAGQH